MMTTKRFLHRSTLWILAALGFVLALLLSGRHAHAIPPDIDLPRGFVQETVADGLDMPTAFALAPDGRIFIAEKAGRVRVVENGVLQPQPFIDISERVNTAVQRGLLGIAVHPRWPAVPYVYLAYSYEPPEAQGHDPEGARVARLVRVSADPNHLNLALPDSEVVLLGKNSTFAHIGNPDRMNHKPYSCQNPDGSYVRNCVANEGNSHTLAQLAFGPDGALYVGSGDGINYSSGNLRAQSVDSLNGKVLRIDPITGDGYASNPFYNGDPGSNRSKVYALGLRYPWRFTFHPRTGQLYIGDVGRSRWEEINRAHPGANFGWPCFDGPEENAFDPECRPVLSGQWPVTQALFAYPHENRRGAVIGGDFVRGGNFPAIYRGAYFYSDFNSATIDYLLFAPDGAVTTHVFSAPAFGVVQLTFGPDGALYVLYHFNQALARIRYTGAENIPPVAVAQATPIGGPPPLEVRFQAGNSYDPEGDRVTFQWNFGDGDGSSLQTPVHVYEKPGRYRVQLAVSDLNATDTDSLEIVVAEGAATVESSEPTPLPRPPTPTSPPDRTTAAGPTSVEGATPAHTLGALSGTPVHTEPAPPGGARILLRVDPRFEGDWSVVQWQDVDGSWKDVEGWRGSIENAHKRWWVGPDLYGAGPFRWLLYDREGGALLAASEEFHLPPSKDEMVVWEAR